jgi:protein SCO1
MMTQARGARKKTMRILTTLFILSLLSASSVSCNQGPSQRGTSQEPSSTKRYHLKGKVISIDKRANMANIDGEEIPGFMGAMAMPYVVKPASELDQLSPGDVLTADVVVQGDDSWIENVVVTAHGTPTSPK